MKDPRFQSKGYFTSVIIISVHFSFDNQQSTVHAQKFHSQHNMDDSKMSLLDTELNQTEEMVALLSGNFCNDDVNEPDTTTSPSCAPTFSSRRGKQRVRKRPRVQNVLAYDTDEDDGDTTEMPLSGVSVVDETIPDKKDDDDNDFLEPPRPANQNTKMNYLITYSSADVIKIPDREAFANFVCKHFRATVKKGGEDIIGKWAVSAESHTQTRGFHYHMALGLKTGRRWANIKKEMGKEGIVCDFRERGGSYFEIFDYVSKLDSHLVYSSKEAHEGLINPPRTAAATKARRRAGNSSKSTSTSTASSSKKQPRLDILQLSKILVEGKIRTDHQLAAFAKKLADDGKLDLQHWFLSHPSPKKRSEILSSIWMLEDSTHDAKRAEKTLMVLLEEAMLGEHSKDKSGRACDGSWLSAALEILSLNNISRDYFSQRVVKALRNGRGKGYNMMICGPTNCAKSFLLMPLERIYNVFFQPSSGSFNWLHAPNAEVLFLNDIRYEEKGDQEVMPWRQFLNLLEGCTVNIRRPGNIYDGDLAWTDSSAPIFATAENPIVRIKHGAVVPGETEQIQERWGDIIWLKHQFLGSDVRYDIISCGKCFAELLLKQ